MMICGIISICAAGLAIAVGIYAAIAPATRGWNGMDDVLLRAGIIGLLALITCIAASIGLYRGEAQTTILVILVVLSSLPASAFIIGGVMLLKKLW